MGKQSRSDSSNHYFADGRRITLHPSSDFVALATSDAGTAAAQDRALGTEGVLMLPERHLVLVPAGQSGALADIEAGVRAAGETTSTPTVFETDEAPGVYLVPNGEVAVRIKNGLDPAAVHDLVARHGAQVLRADYPEPGAYLVTAPTPEQTIELANALHDEDVVEFAEPNFVNITPRPSTPSLLPAQVNGLPGIDLEALAAAPTAADPALVSQWGLAKIRALQAWGISTGSASISVAVIDEGVDTTHEDLSLVLPGYDAYQGDNNPTPAGNDAHGTACSGIVAAIRDNGRGGAGVAPGCRVLPVRIARGIGGGFWDTDSAKVADGIRTAVNRGASVLSNSYGVGPSSLVTNAFAYAATSGRGGKGCVSAAATGNGDVRGVIYPARLSSSVRGMLAVGASNEWDQRKSKTSLDGETWWGSNYGPEVDVVAPGVHIYTTDIMGAAGYTGGNYVPNFNGTSSATPHVAGVAALVLSVDPDLRGWEVEDILKMTAVDLGTAGRDESTGFGRVDARRALEAASRLWYEISPSVEFIGGSAFMRVNARLYNSGINTLRLDSFTLTSHTADWTAEIDRFEYRPNPGGTMLPRTGQDVRFNRILLKANGTPAAWSYRWAASWTYTFWRPAGPSFPMAAPEGTTTGTQANSSGSTRDGADGGTSAAPDTGSSFAVATSPTDRVDDGSRTVTIIVR